MYDFPPSDSFRGNKPKTPKKSNKLSENEAMAHRKAGSGGKLNARFDHDAFAFANEIPSVLYFFDSGN